jgi:hypothetical protein
MKHTKEIHFAILSLLVVIALPLMAQRPNGCSEIPISRMPDIVLDQALRKSGQSLNESRLLTALTDSNPSVRSLAAWKLASLGKKNYVPKLIAVWSGETDDCMRISVHEALGELLRRIWTDDRVDFMHAITPFRRCVPSGREIVSLRVEQMPDPPRLDHGPTARVTVQNLTSEALPFLTSRDPVEVFSATALSSSGQPARLRGCLFTACAEGSGYAASFILLQPLEKKTWVWFLGHDFDMSAAGTYKVSLGAKLEYLETTVCSNIADVRVN